MGNTLSEAEEEQIVEEAYSLSLESPEADKVLNAGTAAPNCQPPEKRMSEKHRRNSSMSEDDRGKRQHTEKISDQKKLSYVQMAKLGYQELVNAIIRPPRADYKVSYPAKIY
jgi:hypothetical protein